jgi:hypothetical protein
MKKHIYLFFILLLAIFILNDIQIIYSNSILYPDYSYILVSLYYIPKAQWNQAFNIPDWIIDSILNINFTKYIIDKRNFQVYYIVYSPSRNK